MSGIDASSKLTGRSTKTVSTQTLKFRLPSKQNRAPQAAAFGFALSWS